MIGFQISESPAEKSDGMFQHIARVTSRTYGQRAGLSVLLMIEGVTIVLREWIFHTVVIVHCDGSRFYHTRDWHEIQ